MNTRSRWFGWWYVCIGLGFAALGVRAFLAGARPWPVAIRCLIAIGFVLLGMGTLRTPRLRR